MGNTIQTYPKEEYCTTFHVTPEEYDAIAAEFNNLTGGANEIPHAVWTEAFCASLGEENKDIASYYESIFSVLDCDKNETLTLDEYMLFQGVLFRGDAKQKLRGLFAIADTSRDNVLTSEELRNVLVFATKVTNRANPDYPGNPNLITDDQRTAIENAVKLMFEIVDTDKNGTIELSEFLTALDQHPELIEKLPFLF